MIVESCAKNNELYQMDRQKAAAILPPAVVEYIDECIAKAHRKSYLIPVLHKVQEHFGYLSQESMDAVSILMQIPSAKVTGVASFYHFFKFSPRGQHRISLCLGTACFVKGAGNVLSKLQELLDVDLGGTTADTLFSVDAARCVGACALAPVMIVDDKVFTEVTPEKVAGILSEYGYGKKKAKIAG
jgi:NADH:ubiquinone oxidoreductase subunit E